jgi:hypothetical protein
LISVCCIKMKLLHFHAAHIPQTIQLCTTEIKIALFSISS